MPMSPRLLRPRASGLVLPTDADARAYVLAVNTADGQPLEAPVVQAIDAFVIGCKADGIWSAIKASCILMGARTLSGALTPLVGAAPTNNGPFVSDDYNRKTGLIGNGTSKYLDSNRNNNADPQNSVHHSAFYSATQTNSAVPIGAGFNLTGATRCAINVPGNAVTVRVRSSSTQTMSALPPLPVNGSLFGYARSSESLTTLRVNGGNTTSTGVSQTPFSGNVFVFGDNNNGTATAFIDGRLAFYSIGESLTLSLLDSRVTALYNAIGAAIP